jgi:hypothetical protein
MFFYKGGQSVRKGTYWDSERRTKIVIDSEDVLPGSKRDIYFKLPESYLLIPLLLLGLFLSMALPYGMGVVAFIAIIILSATLYTAGLASMRLFKEMLGKTATFDYTPTTAYMTGKKVKKVNKEDKEGDEKTAE